MPRTPIARPRRRAAGRRHRQLAGVPGLPPLRAGRRPPPRRLGRLCAVRDCSPSASIARRSRRASISCSTSAARWRVTEQKLRAYGELLGAAGLRLRVHRGRLAHHHDVRPPAAAAAASRRHRALPRLRRRAVGARRGAPAASAPLAARRRERLPVSARRRRARRRGSRATARCWRSSSSRCARKRSRRVEGGRRLVDVEGRGELDLVIDDAAIRDYRARFAPSAAGSVDGRAPRRRALRPRRRRHAAARRGARSSRRRACWRPHDVRDAAGPAGAAGHPGDRGHPSVSPALPGPSRRRAVPVAGRRGRRPEGGGKIARLPITTSLLLECLAALALALILAGARALVRRRQPASRRAARRFGVDGGGQRARRERARPRRAARARRARSPGPRRRARHARRAAAIGRRCSPGPAAFAVEARPRARRAGSRRRRIIRSRSACGWRGSWPAGPARLMVMSDLPPAARGEPARRRARCGSSVGEPLANVGIIAAERTLTPDESRGAVVADARQLLGVRRRARRLTRDGRRQGRPGPGARRAARRLVAHAAAAHRAARRCACRCRTMRWLRDNEVMLAEPRPRIVGVENRLPEGRGRDALAKALDALAGVTARRVRASGVRRAPARSIAPQAAGRVARRVRPRAGRVAGAGRGAGLHRSVRPREAASAAAGRDARRRGVDRARCRWPPAPCVRWCRPAIAAARRHCAGQAAGGRSRRSSSTSISIART